MNETTTIVISNPKLEDYESNVGGDCLMTTK